MKKLLISILIILLIALTCVAMLKGISIGQIDILGVKQIINKNEELDKSIQTATTAIKVDYEAKKSELSSAIDDLLIQKENYFDIAKISTEGEIAKANTHEVYSIEYLWTNIGRHATSKGVNIKMDVTTGDTGEANLKKLFFTATGSYIGIIQFVTSLENDTELNFRIENFRISGESTLTATFNVKNVRVKVEENTSQPEVENDIEEKNTTEEKEQTNTNEENAQKEQTQINANDISANIVQ